MVVLAVMWWGEIKPDLLQVFPSSHIFKKSLMSACYVQVNR